MEKRAGASVRRSGIAMKMYIFVTLTVLAVAAGSSAIAFRTGANQIDRYYKQTTADNARNFASMVDGDFLKELKEAAASEEYQKLRERAVEEDNEQIIEDYLREKGLWDSYSDIRDRITEYLENMEEVKYIYVVAHGDADAKYDMYLVDDKENPIYETGYYEEREAEYLGMDISQLPEPTISNGDWGWLCSDFKPVYSSDGECVCIVGCDVGMDDVMAERRRLLIVLVMGSIVFTSVVLIAAVLFINRSVVIPLNRMTSEMKKFTPAEHLSYEEAGVIDLDIKRKDEIGEIYNGIRSMQINILDYLNDMLTLREDKQKVENDLKDRDERIGQLSKETYKDPLTRVGNKAAYLLKLEELNEGLREGRLNFAMVMVDMNHLKSVNDEFGHKAGDQYIRGCCHMICEAFKHSPVYRIGGDEFVAVLESCDYSNRKKILGELRKSFEASYEQEDKPLNQRYSAAVGMAENASDDFSAEFVFKRADKAMYEDKSRFKSKYGGDIR
ncbi:MAG TPA: hypothetical protein DCL38_01455 [Lachnospiraceae bacterium]|nr:hypothetical protein [Lachnospiraceae bacterium]